ncbi:MAG: NADPH-dependent 7-cyano-7-deazaguanine reductase QueF [Porticoccaceae bacterium]|nr:NADPH-dependent 7-cyano-7-deazaguanine reductase QueF [Porticoccaceae bacterium]
MSDKTSDKTLKNSSAKQGPGDSQSPLGKTSAYPERYQPTLLHPIPRVESRRVLGIDLGINLGIDEQLPFVGSDLWTAYELSWLNSAGVPQVAIGEFSVPCTSSDIIESKSLKLYLNSLNQTGFESIDAVSLTIKRDLSACCQSEVAVALFTIDDYAARGLGAFVGECVDQAASDNTVFEPCFEPSPELLQLEDGGCYEGEGEISECLYSHLLKTNCPVTGQPDWASIVIAYRGRRISRSGLLAYIVSFRQHQDFHEHCVERIFVDIQQRLVPAELTVYARYTRRGGLDINPCRSTLGVDSTSLVEACGRLARQ